jgi:hypothetical protein
MIDRTRARWLTLSALVLVAAWLAIFGDKTPTGSVPLSAPMVAPHGPSSIASRPQAAPQTTALTTLSIERLLPREALVGQSDKAASPRADLFSSRSWALPVALTSGPPASAASSMAPPLPFEVIGKKFEAGRWEVYLSRADKSLIVSDGMEIDDTYQVDKIVPPLIRIVYRPLMAVQILDIGDFE